MNSVSWILSSIFLQNHSVGEEAIVALKIPIKLETFIHRDCLGLKIIISSPEPYTHVLASLGHPSVRP